MTWHVSIDGVTVCGIPTYQLSVLNEEFHLQGTMSHGVPHLVENGTITCWECLNKISEAAAKTADSRAEDIEALKAEVEALKDQVSLLTHALLYHPRGWDKVSDQRIIPVQEPCKAHGWAYRLGYALADPPPPGASSWARLGWKSL